MFKMVKKGFGMKPVSPGATPPSAPVSLPSSPSLAPSKQLSTGESLSVPPPQENTLDLASPVVAAQHTQNRISLISPLDDSHAAMSSPMEYHAGHDESGPEETSEWPIYDSPESFLTMDERMLRQMREREDEEAEREHAGLPAPLQAASAAAATVLSPVVEEPSSSTSSPRVTYSPALPMTPRSGNGSLRPEAHAVLKGSPRVLGWQVDEESEEKAWEIIMKDAVDSSVFDQPAEEEETHLLPHSKEELYRMWLKHWDEVNTSLVWRVVPSLKGIHQWILQPTILGEGSVLSTGVEMGTDTDDLPCHIHADAEAQTTIKSYVDVEVQTYEVEVPPGALMLLPEKPLKAPTQDFDLAQTVPPFNPPPTNSPPTTSPPNERAESIRSETRSRSRSPFRRMIPSRKNSTASINSQVEPEPKPKRSQSPATDTLKRLTSMRSLARGGASTPKGTLNNASSVSVNVAADGSAQARTQSGPILSATPAKEDPVTTTTPERPPIQSSPSQPANGRWGAIRRANFALGWR